MNDFALFRNVAASDAKLARKILLSIHDENPDITKRTDLQRVKHWLSRVSSNVDILLDMSNDKEQQ